MGLLHNTITYCATTGSVWCEKADPPVVLAGPAWRPCCPPGPAPPGRGSWSQSHPGPPLQACCHSTPTAGNKTARVEGAEDSNIIHHSNELHGNPQLREALLQLCPSALPLDHTRHSQFSPQMWLHRIGRNTRVAEPITGIQICHPLDTLATHDRVNQLLSLSRGTAAGWTVHLEDPPRATHSGLPSSALAALAVLPSRRGRR